MASKKKQYSKGLTIVLSIVAVIFGLVIGLFAPLYVVQSYFTKGITTDELVQNDGQCYTKDEIHADVGDVDLTGCEVSVHFLELGNKYTGDCTYIKVGEGNNAVDILIDCGSKSSSIATVKSYLDNFVTDGVIEYVIVTHAHQDHYAGFATSSNVQSIFDLYTCKTIITFAQTNQKATSTLYKNFNRELEEAQSRVGDAKSTVYTALQCYDNTDGASRIFNLTSETNLEILYNKYYSSHATTENNYSVCCMINSGTHKFLFTGDLEEKIGEQAEQALAQNYYSTYGNTSVDLYKAGHHGSKTSSSEYFLSVFNPQRCCVCCCAGSPEYTKTTANQFPTQDFINRIAPYTTDVYVTTLCLDYANSEFTSFNGNIVVAYYPANSTAGTAERISVVCSNDATKLKDTDWFKRNRETPTAWVSP